MFVDLDTSTLRQGDIIAEMPFPLVRLDRKTRFWGTYVRESGGRVDLEAETETFRSRPWMLAQVHAAISFCAVLSQCCDVAAAQDHPPPAFLLCRLVPVNDGMRKNPSAYSTLKENIDPWGTGRPFFSLFYVGMPAALDKEYVADYGQVMTVVWSDYGAVLRRKILQMDDLNRAKFRIKASAHIGRVAKEDEGIGYPWIKAEPLTDG
ncbi:MAG TPA: hypothetical protein VGQ12_02005 [Candidatus Angelobacter sp.]|jgi:hypothetical protein|nr:hypothetical protein [Candidatus Angelobacter sp.]